MTYVCLRKMCSRGRKLVEISLAGHCERSEKHITKDPRPPVKIPENNQKNLKKNSEKHITKDPRPPVKIPENNQKNLKKNKGKSITKELPLVQTPQNEETKNNSPSKISVLTSSSSTKRYFCKFCKKTVAKFARHITSVHQEETRVQEILYLPKKSEKRNSLIGQLRIEGSYEFNTDKKFNAGELIVARRPSKNKNRANDYYVPCVNCKNYYSKKSVFVHYKKCSNQSNSSISGKQFHQKSRSLSNRIHVKANRRMVQEICPVLNPDNISATVCFDELIILFGNKLTCKYRSTHLGYHIRQILRSLARFLIEIKKIESDINDLKSVYQPRYYNSVLEAVNILAGLNSLTNEYNVPSIATRLGTYIKKCGNLLITEYIKSGEEKKIKLVKQFLKLHAEDYGTYINKTAIESQIHAKRNKHVELPLHEDVTRLHKYLSTQTDELEMALSEKYSYLNWLQLAKCVLTSIQIFNRRRPGEIERLLISDFEKRESIEINSDLYKSLTTLEKYLAARFMRIEIRGKLGRTVPILLSLKQVEIIKTIMNYRKDAQVHENNPYVFACPGAVDRHIRACVALKDFASRCGAKHPENLRGTKLRKQIATVVQILNLSEGELGQLANFMGHDIQIHKDHYRLPSTALQIGQLSKLLLIMEDGSLAKHKGKKLNEIENIEHPQATIESPTSAASTKSDEEYNIPSKVLHQTPPSNKESRLVSSDHKHRDARRKLFDEDPDFEPVKEIEESPCFKRKKVGSRQVSPMGKIVRRTWMTPEKSAARQYLNEYVKSGKLPTSKYCAQLIKLDARLKRRTALQLKAWVNNQIKHMNLENVIKSFCTSNWFWKPNWGAHCRSRE